MASYEHDSYQGGTYRLQSRISDFSHDLDHELSYMSPVATRDTAYNNYHDDLTLLSKTPTDQKSDGRGITRSATLRNQLERQRLYRGASVSSNTTVSRVWDWINQRKAWAYVRLKLNLGVVDTVIDEASHPHRGWRTAVLVSAFVTLLVLVTNALFAIVTAIKYPANDGIGLIFEGDCTTVHRWDTGVHLGINILGTMLLGASSFTMQCLSSPTRSEVNAAHAKRKAMQVGVPSFTNLIHMPRYKTVLWAALAISTLPLHLMWNSTVFSTDSVSLFSVVAAEESFLTGATFQEPNITSLLQCADYTTASTNITAVSDMLAGYKAGNYTRLDSSTCLTAYTGKALGNRRNLIAIVDFTSGRNMSTCGYPGELISNNTSVVGYFPNQNPQDTWIASATYVPTSNWTIDVSREQILRNNTWFLGPYGSDSLSDGIANDTSQLWPVKYCLSETTFYGGCQLQYVSWILYVVIVCNVIKVICMGLVAHYLWDLNEPILATCGDAVASFVEVEDATTREWCLIDLKAKTNVSEDNRVLTTRKYAFYNRKPRTRLYHATSAARWWTTVSLCTLYMTIGFVLCGLTPSIYEQYSNYGSSVFDVAWASVEQDMTLPNLTSESSGALMTDIIIANSFQLVLSTMYFLYNSLYTAQAAALEWASFARGLRTLRVTWPVGQQRSTYYLHLPWRYGIPLALLLMCLHFLISQSIFLARAQQYFCNGNIDVDNSFSAVGFSSTAILVTCFVGLFMILCQVVHSLRPLDNRIPIHGNSSMAISAMCHVLKDSKKVDAIYADRIEESESIATRPLMWGVTRRPIDRGVYPDTALIDDIRGAAGHCSFTTERVSLPEQGRVYL